MIEWRFGGGKWVMGGWWRAVARAAREGGRNGSKRVNGAVWWRRHGWVAGRVLRVTMGRCTTNPPRYPHINNQNPTKPTNGFGITRNVLAIGNVGGKRIAVVWLVG